MTAFEDTGVVGLFVETDGEFPLELTSFSLRKIRNFLSLA